MSAKLARESLELVESAGNYRSLDNKYTQNQVSQYRAVNSNGNPRLLGYDTVPSPWYHTPGDLKHYQHHWKKDVKSRKGNDAHNLHRKKKRDGMVMRRKPKKEIECSGRVQLSVEELRMRLRVHEDRTEGNVCFLQRLGARSCWDAKATNKIFERSVKCRTDKSSSEPQEESTVFTEEDFKKFEEEYFVN